MVGYKQKTKGDFPLMYASQVPKKAYSEAKP